jgi:hypothetical protein
MWLMNALAFWLSCAEADAVAATAMASASTVLFMVFMVPSLFTVNRVDGTAHGVDCTDMLN